MTTSAPEAGTAPDADTSVPSAAHVSASGPLAELARVSSHRENLQGQLEAVHAESWSR